MSNRNFQSVSTAYEFGGLTGFGGSKPPSNGTLSAALGLGLSACVAIRLAIEVPRNGNMTGVLIAGRHVVTAATLLISHASKGSFSRVWW
jgi:hypothetical protein